MLVMDNNTAGCITKFEDLTDHYEFLEELGRFLLINWSSILSSCLVFKHYPFRGKFALVRKCRNKKTGELFAAKVYGKRAGRRGERSKALNNEIRVLGDMPPHPRIVKLWEVYHGQNEVVLILELYVTLL